MAQSPGSKLDPWNLSNLLNGNNFLEKGNNFSCAIFIQLLIISNGFYSTPVRQLKTFSFSVQEKVRICNIKISCCFAEVLGVQRFCAKSGEEVAAHATT